MSVVVGVCGGGWRASGGWVCQRLGLGGGSGGGLGKPLKLGLVVHTPVFKAGSCRVSRVCCRTQAPGGPAWGQAGSLCRLQTRPLTQFAAGPGRPFLPGDHDLGIHVVLESCGKGGGRRQDTQQGGRLHGLGQHPWVL